MGKKTIVLFCAVSFCLVYMYLYCDVLMYTSYIYPLVYVPDSSHKVLEIIDCCNVVVVHFNVNIWVDPPGRVGEVKGGEEGGEVEGGEVEGGEVKGGEVEGEEE